MWGAGDPPCVLVQERPWAGATMGMGPPWAGTEVGCDQLCPQRWDSLGCVCVGAESSPHSVYSHVEICNATSNVGSQRCRDARPMQPCKGLSAHPVSPPSPGKGQPLWQLI